MRWDHRMMEMTMTENYHTATKTEEPTDVYEALDRSIELHYDMIENMRELKKALRLAELVGRKPGELKWSLSTRWIEGHSSFFPWQGARLHVRENHPDGPIEHEVPILDVHRDLWPEHLRRGYEMDEARKAKRRKPPFMASEPH
jgi:hypothetical protein